MVISALSLSGVSAKEVRDTVWTCQNDKIILTYRVSSDNNLLAIDFSHPRIIPSASLTKACKGEYDKLKVVVFDRIGDFGKVKWAGLSPTALMVPNGLSYEMTSEGFYILGESQPIEFHKLGQNTIYVRLPLYIAVYDKKQNYRIVSSSQQPVRVSSEIEANRSGERTGSRTGTETERIAITSYDELEAENSDIAGVLSSIEMVGELLSRETEVPFSQTLQMEIYHLRSLKQQIKEPDIAEKINEVLLLCSDKERELKEAQNQAEIAARAEEHALVQQQKQEAEAQQRAAEERARLREEKQQKRTLWMIIGGAILAIFGFIGNAVFKHFRDINNQKSILQMQQSLAQQAEHEAGRRSREIIRNRAHQLANRGRGKLNETINSTVNPRKNTKRRSI